jgi:hypothetical protein
MEPAAMSMCIRYQCDRKARPGMVVCEDCLDRLLYGRVAADTTPAPVARPERPTAPVAAPAGLSELELLYRFGR